MKRARRHSVLALLGVAGAAAVSLPIFAQGGPGLYPDLRSDAVADVSQPAVYFDTEGGVGNGRLLVRFEGYVTNLGTGALEVSGNPQPGAPPATRIRQKTTGGIPTAGNPVVTFEANDSHNHWHLNNAMRYSLWNSERTAEVAPGQKVGFCLYDSQRVADTGPPSAVYDDNTSFYCDQGVPESTDLIMGVSAGWRDIYDKGLAFQWVDVSNTAPGSYVVGAQSDPNNTIWEGGGSGETNAPVFNSTPVTVPGWNAQGVTLAQTGAPQAVPLSAQKFGTQSNGNLRYRITSAPARGSLNVPLNTDLAAGQQVVYTPQAGYSGSDGFTYVARSTASEFPTNPVTATVTIADGTPRVAISGAPASLVAGTSAQLAASPVNLPAGVAWSANAGTVSAAGLFTAPATPPAGGVATVRATSSANPAVASQVAITITPRPKPKPKPDPFAKLTAGKRLLSPLAVKRLTKSVFVAKVVTGRKGGRVTITTTRKGTGKVLKRCSARLGARKGLTCKVTLKRNQALSKVRVTAKFVATKGGATAVRRASIPR